MKILEKFSTARFCATSPLYPAPAKLPAVAAAPVKKADALFAADETTPAADDASPAVYLSSPAAGVASPAIYLSSPTVYLPSPAVGEASPAVYLPSPTIYLPSPAINFPSPAVSLPSGRGWPPRQPTICTRGQHRSSNSNRGGKGQHLRASPAPAHALTGPRRAPTTGARAV